MGCSPFVNGGILFNCHLLRASLLFVFVDMDDSLMIALNLVDSLERWLVSRLARVILICVNTIGVIIGREGGHLE